MCSENRTQRTLTVSALGRCSAEIASIYGLAEFDRLAMDHGPKIDERQIAESDLLSP